MRQKLFNHSLERFKGPEATVLPPHWIANHLTGLPPTSLGCQPPYCVANYLTVLPTTSLGCQFCLETQMFQDCYGQGGPA